jgi:hypothetical protein
VTWQEDLRRLDEELASGKLSADDYRARRDQVLSSAVTSGAQSPQPQHSSGEQANSTQIIEPVSPSHGVPQAPPQPQFQLQQQFQPQAPQPLPPQAPQQRQPQPPDSPEATQVVSAADSSGEQTQVVPSWQTRPPSPAGGFPQPQQHGPASPAGGFAPPQQNVPTWNAAREDVSPPWGASEFPPIAPSRSSEWVAQGPETFEATPSSGKGRKVAFSLVAVVVLAGLGFAIWLLFIKDGGQSTVASPTDSRQSAPPAPTTKPLPEPPVAKPEPADNDSALIKPPGNTRAGGGTFDLSGMKSNKLLPTSVLDALGQAGMTEGLLKATTNNSSKIGLFALNLPDPQGAGEVAQEYARVQRTGGIPANQDLSMNGVQVFSSSGSASESVFRAVYVLYNRVIIVETIGPDRTSVQKQFQELLSSQVQHAPPTQRGN